MIKVTAIANGYYGGKIRVPGEEFGIADLAAFSTAWMTSDDASVKKKFKGELADLPDDGEETRRVNTGGTDGVVGEEVPKGKKGKAKAAELAAAGSDNDDRSRDMAIDATANAALPTPDWEQPTKADD